MTPKTEGWTTSTYGRPPEQWAKAKQEIRDILITKARERAMIPYSELVDMVDSVQLDAFGPPLSSMLGQLSLEEHELGRPLLSVLVVHKLGDMKPGVGFFELAQQLGRQTSDTDKAWITEVQKVFQYWNR